MEFKAAVQVVLACLQDSSATRVANGFKYAYKSHCRAGFERSTLKKRTAAATPPHHNAVGLLIYSMN